MNNKKTPIIIFIIIGIVAIPTVFIIVNGLVKSESINTPTEIKQIDDGNELANIRNAGLTGNVDLTISGPDPYSDGTTYLGFFTIIVSDFMLANYLGLDVNDLYLENGSSCIIFQQLINEPDGSERYFILFKNQDNIWYVRVVYTDLTEYDWLLGRLLEMNA